MKRSGNARQTSETQLPKITLAEFIINLIKWEPTNKATIPVLSPEKPHRSPAKKRKRKENHLNGN